MSTEYFPFALSPPAARVTTNEAIGTVGPVRRNACSTSVAGRVTGKPQRLSALCTGGTSLSSTRGIVFGNVVNAITTLWPVGVTLTSVTTGRFMSSFLNLFLSDAAFVDGSITDRREIFSAPVLVGTEVKSALTLRDVASPLTGPA